MLPEQQQRILGYFIEEARDHLNTIEQGLLNLQSTLNDPEMVNEVFRAAHSIKGSAAMLGLNSIQHTSHRLEDCFKVLKEHPVEVDQKLESLFLGVCDTLKVLLEHLSGPFGLSEEAANTLMSETEPVFVWLYEHLELLVQQNSSGEVKKNTTQAEQNWQDSVTTLTDLFLRDDILNLEADTESTSTESPLFVESPEADSLLPPPVGEYGDEFETQVLPVLREMLQLFKKQTTPESRNNLQQCCQQLVRLGQRWNLHHWCRLCQAAANAIANPENTYLTLAKIVITDIKQAQELVLQGRETEIVSSQRLAALLNLPEPESSEPEDLFAHQPASVVEPTANEELSSTTNNFASEPNILQPTDSITSLTELSDQLQPIQDTSAATENTVPETASNQMLFLNYQEGTDISKIGQHGPLVGLSELNTLADLFEGDTPELDETWQQEENLEISAANKLGINFSDSNIEDVDSDLADFLSLDEGKSDDDLDSSLTTTEELNLLFGNNLAEAEQLNQQNKSTSVALYSESQEYSGNTNLNELSGDLLASTPDENKLLPTSEITQAEQISTNQQSSVDDLFVETNNANNADTEEILLDDDLEAQPTIVQPESLTLDALFDDFDNIADSPQLSHDDSEISDLFEITPPLAIELTQVEDNLNDFWNQESATEQDEVVSVLEQDVAKALEESLFAAAASSDIFGKIADFSPSSSTSMELEDDDLNLHEPDLELPSDTGESDDLFADLAASHSFSSNDDDEQDLSLEEISGFDQEPVAITESLTSMKLEDDDLNLHEPDLELPSDTGESDDLFADLAASHSFSSNDDDEQDLTLTESLTSMELEDDDLNLHEPDLELPSDTGESDDLFADLAASYSFSSNDDDEQDLTLTESLTSMELEDDDLNLDEPDLELPSDTGESDDLFADLAASHSFSSNDDDEQDLTLTESLTSMELEDDDLNLDEPDLELPSDTGESDDLFADLAASHSLSSSDEDEQDLSLEEISGFDQEPVAITESLTSMKLEDDDLNLDEPDLELPSDTGESDDLFADLAASYSFSSNDDDEQDLTLEEISGFAQEPEALDLTPEFTKEPLQIDAVDSPPVFADLEVDLFDSLDENPQILGSEISETDNSTYVQLDNADDYSADESNLEFGEDILEKIANLSDDLFNTDPISENANVVLPEEEVTSVSSAAEATLENDPTGIQDEFAELEALLEEEAAESSDASIPEKDFADLEALLNTSDDDQEGTVFNDKLSYAPQFELTTNQAPRNSIELSDADDEFSDLEKLLAEADQSISHSSPNKTKLQTSKIARSSDRRTARFEETMKVPVKQLDDMSNLVGELVVNRNTLEQDHERLRQSLDNLLIQVQHLSDVGARMQELYERSLLEASLLASRKTKERKETKEKNLHTNDSHSNMGFSELEMDRFTPFHTLSQEMIEFIVRVRESASDIDFVTEETERVARQFRQVTTQLQEGLTRARMVPFSQTIDRLRRGVRDNAIKYGKQVDLVIEGGDILIDKMILDHLTDPLTHMLNNAIAHGIETPEIRQQSGKQPVGVITIRAFYQGHQTVISVGDDGAGIDPERVKTKAVQIGMMTATQAKSISRMEVYDLLFQPGFSIKDKADEISGRGVGMDVVRSEISDIRGIVNTDSAIGKGTTFTIRLPVTLSICKALFCVSDKARIAFPMDGVEDTLDIPVNSIQHHADGQSYISWRDTLLPFQPLKELLTFNRQLSRGNVYGGNRDDGMVSVVVVRSGNTLIALQIDLVLSEQEIVIKQFESPVPKPIGVAGATVLGDGRIMPIADVLEIIEIFQGRISKHNGDKLWQQQEDIPNLPETTVEKIDPTVLIVDDSITVRELLSLTFNKAGYRVEQARDGQEAWDKLRSGLPCDIVFCDIEMPRCDGLELLSRIQKDSSLNHLPIAMLTSRGADKHRQMAIQLGASGYFTKPYLEEALLEAAVRMLKGEKLVNA
ncbi:response regulator [Nodularia spumigena]|uniref:response regulator n=4 Tax=Nodularia spumigena TaxID=70799 RepID=UPI0000EAB921|nr:response regulator [Nodularia spumigena]AHJ26781.1 Signal transduction histidine kinase CheA [Nodularia spumigena CCY9414]EAW47054.1 two-component hybrid sensor and regulator [Nodularia spumigena CCY9414]